MGQLQRVRRPALVSHLQLAQLSNKAIHAPWMAAPLELQAAGVALGKDYPHPIVAHDAARLRTLDRYAVVKKLSPTEQN